MIKSAFFSTFLVSLTFSVSLYAKGAEVPSKADLITSVEGHKDVEAQMEGAFPPLARQELAPLGAIQHAWDKAPLGAGVYTALYNPREVIKVRLREFMTTTVVFPLWEKIDHIMVGDEKSFEAKAVKANLLSIRPLEHIGIDTNITVMGKSGNVYTLYVRVEGYNSKHVSDLTVFIKAPFIHQAAPALESPQTNENPDYLEPLSFDPTALDFDFTMKGDESIAPERVYTDGKRTWFDYGPKIGQKTLPAIFALIDEVDAPINVTRVGTKLVAHRAGSFTLKSGKLVTCVYPSKAKAP